MREVGQLLLLRGGKPVFLLVKIYVRLALGGNGVRGGEQYSAAQCTK